MLLATVLSEKFKCFENGTILFRTSSVEIHQALVYIIYVKTSQIGVNQLSEIDRGLHGMAHILFLRPILHEKTEKHHFEW